MKNILLSGVPGIGKTTVIVKLAEMLGDKAVGFYTSEIRAEGKRVGFSIRSLDGFESILAHVDIRSKYRVGRYGVDLEGLERAICGIEMAMEAGGKRYILIDEIGKMELFSERFREFVTKALDSPLPVVATIFHRPHPFCDLIKARDDVRIVEVTVGNRDGLPRKLYMDLLNR
jgi:nucleoside-triphosphatase